MEKSQNIWSRLLKTYRDNSEQLRFGSYAAEMSFYVIWAMVPILLALANVIAILPIKTADILAMMRNFVPAEVQSILLPILQGYLENTSPGVFSLGLIISLWPASNVFNTLQRVFNEIYKVEPRKNLLISRGFAYLFMIFMVLLIFAVTSLLVFGESILHLVEQRLPDYSGLVSLIVQQGWIFGVILVFCLLVLMYYIIPNVHRPLKYALPGAIFSFVGIFLISQLFTIYLSFAGNSISNQTLGIFIILMIWLYFNSMVLCVGAYLNVFYYDFKNPKADPFAPYQGEIIIDKSDGFISHQPVLKDQISIVKTDSDRSKINEGN